MPRVGSHRRIVDIREAEDPFKAVPEVDPSKHGKRPEQQWALGPELMLMFKLIKCRIPILRGKLKHIKRTKLKAKFCIDNTVKKFSHKAKYPFVQKKIPLVKEISLPPFGPHSFCTE